MGTGKNALRIETLNYRFGLFLDASCKIDRAQNEEIDALRISVMQHRVALDTVCVLFNTTCCTYIPDNVHSNNMTEALKTLKQLQDVQTQDYASVPTDWWKWLFSGSWTVLLYKGLAFLALLLVLLCVFSTCILPCFESMVLKMIFTSLTAYISIPIGANEDAEEDNQNEDGYV